MDTAIAKAEGMSGMPVVMKARYKSEARQRMYQKIMQRFRVSIVYKYSCICYNMDTAIAKAEGISGMPVVMKARYESESKAERECTRRLHGD